MKKFIVSLFVLVSLSVSAMVPDSDRVWREHIITDAATQKTMSLVGYFPHPESEDQSIPYILHIAAMQRHQAFYMNMSSLIDNFHPKTPIVVQVGETVKYFEPQNRNINGIAESIRVSDSTVTMKLFSYQELNTCTGEYYNLVNSDSIHINYLTTAGDIRDVTLNTSGLIDTMQRIYKIPDSCNKESSTVITDPEPPSSSSIDWIGMIITSLILMWVIYVSVKAKQLGRRTWVWFLFGFMLTPMVSHITLKILTKRYTKKKEV
ncbi:hypothetical protein 65p406 [Aeromonas phage 65]|uniref:Uncharacterized protein n=2 Tax=Ishigurovirus osborne TaxID=260149 RepID=A0A219YCV2_9CAUD|nr:hypothetical protein ST65p406 [Aeromonas phage 65]ADQ53413.1 hypothetical protein 65p406 [Aeromonas phage 65]APU01770.1 hypothetical protein [Aeromonas phage 65.2]